MSDEDIDIDFGFDDEEDFAEDNDYSEDEEEDFEEEEDEEKEDEEEDFDVNIVEDEDEFAHAVLNKPVKEENVKIGINVGNNLRNIYNQMIAQLPRVNADNFTLSYFSEEEKQDLAVVVITKTKDTNQGYGTLYDPRMGPIHPGKICPTCTRTIEKCPGHYGRIEVPHLIHPMAENQIVQTLKSVCHGCSKILISEKTFELKELNMLEGNDRLAAIAKISETTGNNLKHCDAVIEVMDPDGNLVTRVCNTVQQIYLKTHENALYYQIPTGTKEKGKTFTLTPKEIYSIFNNISDKDAATLGFGEVLKNEKGEKVYKMNMHPRNFIVQSILVPPNCVRPRIEDTGVGTGEWLDIGDTEFRGILTQKEVWEKTMSAEAKSNAAREIWFNYKQLLISDPNAKGGRRSISIKTRFKGKTGTFHAVIGKRAEQGARSVISGNNWIGFGKVGVPKFAKYKITIPVRVFEANRALMQKLLRQGEVQSIIRKNGVNAGNRRYVNDEIRRNYKLQTGDIVRRFLQNGDPVFFGRQPSLSAGSLMTFRAIIIEDNTFQFSIASTKSFNADYDGRRRFQILVESKMPSTEGIKSL